MNCLENYLKIFEQYPLHDNRFKKERNVALHNWRVAENEYPILKKEICGFIKNIDRLINLVFIKRAICPLIDDCVNTKEYAFIDDLIQTFGIDENKKISIKEVIRIYLEHDQRKKSPVQFVNEILQYNSSEALLELKFSFIQELIYYSIHELPVGILEADILSMQSYNKVFDEVEEIAQKLNKKTDIDKIRPVFDAYFGYLHNNSECASFEEYLNKNKVDYECLFNHEQ